MCIRFFKTILKIIINHIYFDHPGAVVFLLFLLDTIPPIYIFQDTSEMLIFIYFLKDSNTSTENCICQF